jgi:integrase
VAVSEFASWTGIARPETLAGAELDGHVTRYLDHLFLEGYNHERGDKLLAALLHLAPGLGRAAQGSFPRARAAMKGFRRLAHGLSRSPLPKEAAFALIGHSLALGRREFALALLIGWDAMLRMPVDIMGITPRWLVPPVPAAGAHRWGLLLYPEDESRRSKVAGADESVILDLPVWGPCSHLLAELRSRPPTQCVWSFTTASFSTWFAEAVRAAGLPATTCPYQLRHGAASSSILFGTLTLEALQARLRHGALASTRRYEKHTRYLSELAGLGAPLRDYGAWVHDNLTGLLLGTVPACKLPPATGSPSC